MSRLMVNRRFRNTSPAIALLQKAYELGIYNKIEVAISHCKPYLLPLYLRMGCRPFGQVTTAFVGGPQLPIVLLLNDYEFLNSIQSPLKKYFGNETEMGGLIKLRDFFLKKPAIGSLALNQFD